MAGDRACANRLWSDLVHHSAGLIFFVADLFHPLDTLAVEMFDNGNVRHGRRARRAVPMLLIRWAADHVAWSDFHDRAAPTLDQTAARRHNRPLQSCYAAGR